MVEAIAGETEVAYLARLVADLKDMDTTRFTPGQRIAHLDAVRRAVVDLTKESQGGTDEHLLDL